MGCNWNDLSVKQKQKYLELNQGPRQRFSKIQAIPITIYYGALLAVGVPGNLLTCLIITTNSYMRTPPNFFLLNLAATDLLTLTRNYCECINNSLLPFDNLIVRISFKPDVFYQLNIKFQWYQLKSSCFGIITHGVWGRSVVRSHQSLVSWFHTYL